MGGNSLGHFFCYHSIFCDGDEENCHLGGKSGPIPATTLPLLLVTCSLGFSSKSWGSAGHHLRNHRQEVKCFLEMNLDFCSRRLGSEWDG